VFLAAALAGAADSGGARVPVKAAYVYEYMPATHVDSLAARGFDRAIVHWLADSLDTGGRARLAALAARGHALGVDLVPEWLLQSPAFVAARPPGRRYTHGRGVVEPEAACPLDSVYWKRALFDRAGEFLDAEPGITRLAVDLEIWRGTLHHYRAGPCRCASCVGAYTAGAPRLAGRDPARLTGLLAWEEGRLERMLRPLLAGFAARHPGVALEVLDLDLDSFVHRALARALAATGVPTTDYTECSYSEGAAPLAAARARLDALGLRDAPIVGGLWLKRFTPSKLPKAAREIRAASDGWFVFTTYSLWLDPARLSGPYTLPASQERYWHALEEANR
jgi:hypothetical protein